MHGICINSRDNIKISLSVKSQTPGNRETESHGSYKDSRVALLKGSPAFYLSSQPVYLFNCYLVNCYLGGFYKRIHKTTYLHKQTSNTDRYNSASFRRTGISC